MCGAQGGGFSIVDLSRAGCQGGAAVTACRDDLNGVNERFAVVGLLVLLLLLLFACSKKGGNVATAALLLSSNDPVEVSTVLPLLDGIEQHFTTMMEAYGGLDCRFVV